MSKPRWFRSLYVRIAIGFVVLLAALLLAQRGWNVVINYSRSEKEAPSLLEGLGTWGLYLTFLRYSKPR